ncbi:conserved Plasmodium protein, unknown function [Plasmodium ovale wallikeri]|uniref:Uncharacterized protein n=1 Tax=Plasmodium ovale wallikeri TaxID=864142 RepID=A0A1A8ZY78_PLAOA|nr:conserved Plasmodium protein, unknown function [Plasmodium ovale wallikeri]SBT48848.1 conserved Plasmodium protein, unknown function [Plasmodium ovale wallikeri]
MWKVYSSSQSAECNALLRTTSGAHCLEGYLILRGKNKNREKHQTGKVDCNSTLMRSILLLGVLPTAHLQYYNIRIGSESQKQLLTSVPQSVRNKSGNSTRRGTAFDENTRFEKKEEINLFDEHVVNTLGKSGFFKYTEYSLSSLYISEKKMAIEKDASFQKLVNIITKASDVNNKFKWVDSYFIFDVKEEVNILAPRSQKKDFIFREYLEPNHLKGVSLLRKYEQGAIFKSSEKNKVNVKIVSEYIVHDTYKEVIKSFDYHLSHKLFTEAHVFHSKYGNSDHIAILVLRHYKDENFSIPLFNDRVLVQIKSYSSDIKYSDITQKNLLNYAEIFKPLISLRKVDYNFVEKIKEKLSYAV